MRVRARRRAVVPVEHRVHPPHQRARRRRRRPPHRVRRRVPRARARRRVPRRPGRDAGRSPPPPGHHEVQPGAHLDAGERGRDRRRVPVHLRHGGAGRLPVRRPHGAGVEPLRTRARTSTRQPWLLRFFDRIRWYPVDADELLEMRAEARAGRLELDVEDGVFAGPTTAPRSTRDAGGIDAFRLRARRRSTPSARAGRRRGAGAGRRPGARAGDLDLEDALGGSLPDTRSSSRRRCTRACGGSTSRRATWSHRATVLVSLEAMKIETTVPAPVGGTVSRVLCRVGQVVAPGAPLVVLVADD